MKLTLELYKLILHLNKHGSINSAISQFISGKTHPKISNIDESYLKLFATKKTPHELFGDCLNEYNKVQEIKKNLIK
jgi:hypothetical protein